MGFFEYFKDKLRYILLGKPGPLAQMGRGGGAALDQAQEDVYWLREQFLPALSGKSFLVYFAAARGIRRHRFESDVSFQARVIYAFAWQLKGGRHKGLRDILELYGFPGATVTNMRTVDPNRWAEFMVDLDAPSSLTQENWDTVSWAIDEYKPARSKLAALRFFLRAESRPTVRMFPMMGEYIIVYPLTVSEVAVQSLVNGVVAHGLLYESMTVYPKQTI